MTRQLYASTILLTAFLAALSWGQPAYCQWEGREEQLSAVEKTFGTPAEAVRLAPKERVWVDRKKHRVIVDGYIAINEGQLEMFACPVFTKEHEAVVAVFARSISIHAGLLAVGAETGTTAKWDPEYAPPTGSEIQIQAYWKDENGKAHEIDARKWIRDVSGKDKHLEPNWVFAGSGFWEDPDTKQKVYNAESGDLICVSNFSTAALDIPVKSTQANSGLIFIAYTANMPKPGTPVRLVLQVVNPKPPKPKDDPAGKANPTEKTDAKSDSKSEAKPAAEAEGATAKPDAAPEKKSEPEKKPEPVTVEPKKP